MCWVWSFFVPWFLYIYFQFIAPASICCCPLWFHFTVYWVYLCVNTNPQVVILHNNRKAKQNWSMIPPLVSRTCLERRAARACSARESWPVTCRTASLWFNNSTRSSKSWEMRNTTRWSSWCSGESWWWDGVSSLVFLKDQTTSISKINTKKPS